MKKKFRRSLLLLALIVIIYPLVQGCSKTTDVSEVKATFDANTITVSSPEDNTFRLSIKFKVNSKTSSWTSENLSINGVVPQTYDLETLVASYISQDAQITSVSVEPANVEDSVTDIFLGAVIGIVIGALLMGLFMVSMQADLNKKNKD